MGTFYKFVFQASTRRPHYRCLRPAVGKRAIQDASEDLSSPRKAVRRYLVRTSVSDGGKILSSSRTVHDIFETPNHPRLLVYIIQPRYLNQPANIMGEELVGDDPLGELVPLLPRATVYADTPFTILHGWSSLSALNESQTLT